jgi:hypothetical protein
VKGLIQRCLKRVGRWAAGPVALLAGLGAHVTALVVLGALVVALSGLACLMWRWTFGSTARSDRVIRMILALHGDPSSLPQRASAQSPCRQPGLRRTAAPQAAPAGKAALTSRAAPPSRRRKC